ncbi:MAG: acetate--CoA ligase [Flavobacteriia bacterium]|nr:MAG: acetate--CoA ligase [Flavobacteriia bacterium]
MHYDKIYASSKQNPEAFWLEQAQKIKWFETPKTALEQDNNGLYNWFPDGKLNLSYLAVDKHIEDGFGDQPALIHDSAVRQEKTIITYDELKIQVEKLAGGLKQLGVTKGDTVIIYMPNIPQAVYSMLACVRIGAIHSVVFGGFAPRELALRINDAKPKVIITASSGIEVDRLIAYKPMVDEAINTAEHKPEKVILYNRKLGAIVPKKSYDVDYEELVSQAEPETYIPVESSHPSYILYTSGTTGSPKGVVRDTGGYAVALNFSMETIYGVKPGEVFWAGSDVGWVVGHSYIVYGPLIHRNPTVMFEGKPVRTPDAGAFWRVIEDHKVSVLFTAPTAFRAIKQEDPEGLLISDYDTSSLKFLFLAGERCDEPTRLWVEEHLNVPAIDHWWQTESGWPMLSNFMGLEPLPIKSGSVGKPVPGYDIQILTEDGNKAKPNEEGLVVIKLPMPPGFMPTLWQANERYKAGYLQRFPGYYFSGDGGTVDEEGFVYITGRVDDVINVSGHRLSTTSMEEVVARHKAVAECCVIGIENEIKGQVPLGFVVTKMGEENYEYFKLKTEVKQMVRQMVGPIASLKNVVIVKRLPKTRSGKILRNTLRKIVDGKAYVMPSTIEDPLVLEEIIVLLKELRIGAFAKDKAAITSSLKILADTYYNIDSLAKYIDVYRIAQNDPEDFWNTLAENNFYWRKTWDKVLEWDQETPDFKWFQGAKLNITENCLDRHLETRGSKTAIIWEPNSPKEKAQHISYNELSVRVNKMANVLKNNGITKGDRVCIYLPMIPELTVAILACARIGAVHSVVFAGFSSKALSTRINDSQCKMVITSDGSYRGTKSIDLKGIVDEALKTCSGVESVLVVKRTHDKVTMVEGRDKWMHEELPEASTECLAEEMDAEDLLFILYTSGSTGKPKGMVHTTGGYMVYTAYTFKNVFQYKENDVYWCTADIGWITGHSYIVYGPLANGATSLMFEGVPSYPDFGRFWEIVEKHKVNQFYTAPTAIRTLAKQPLELVEKHDLSSLKVLGTVGEPINEEAWHWYNDNIGKKKCPIVDTWWQTETGGIMISPLPFITPTKPTYATLPLPGIIPVLVDEQGNEVDGIHIDGRLCIKHPWPGMARTIYGDHQRFKRTYYSAFKSKYFTGDGAYRDEVGYYRISGRVDDVIIVSGHNLGTAPIENAINEHPAIAESAIVGFPHDIKGNAMYGYVILKEIGEGRDPKDLRREINQIISEKIGPIAKLDKIQFVAELPKTRSGKIMRRILRKIASGETDNFGDITTLLNAEVVQQILKDTL